MFPALTYIYVKHYRGGGHSLLEGHRAIMHEDYRSLAEAVGKKKKKSLRDYLHSITSGKFSPINSVSHLHYSSVLIGP